MLLAMALLMGGLSWAGMMIGLAVALFHARRLGPIAPEAGEADSAGGEPVSGASPATSSRGGGTAAKQLTEPETLDEVLRLLREIADNSLLSDEQKRLKLERLRRQERRRCVDRIEQSIRDEDYARARQACKDMEARFGADPEIDQLIEKIEQARSQAEAKHVVDAHRKISDLMSVSAWDRAKQVVEELLAKHPDSDRARDLASLVAREQETFERQQRRRLYADIERHTSRRQWRQALEVAGKLIERHGDSPEAHAIRAQLETLDANAEIQERQELEARIKDLIKKRRFGEAVDLARTVIQNYPDSPQAEVLRSQLARLEDKAK